MLEATYSYFANGPVGNIICGKRTMTWFEYDAANRLMNIDRSGEISADLPSLGMIRIHDMLNGRLARLGPHHSYEIESKRVLLITHSE